MDGEVATGLHDSTHSGFEIVGQLQQHDVALPNGGCFGVKMRLDPIAACLSKYNNVKILESTYKSIERKPVIWASKSKKATNLN